SWGPQLRGGDVVRAPFPRVAEAPVDPRDLAAVAARALVDDDLVGRKLVLTGPESLTHEQLVATIGHVLGRELRFVPVDATAAAAGMVAHGQRPEFVAALMARYEREDGKPALVTGDVAKVLGRPARTFAEWVADHADLFR
ncbi:MAG: nucleoside-diphosphate sugar epimerase, partial [Actinomycetota bacterium]|nr:nucleoside-diphosphate sugar epimerase [Actinomycetota bacterium]